MRTASILGEDLFRAGEDFFFEALGIDLEEGFGLGAEPLQGYFV